MSTFDKDAFLAGSVDGSNATRFDPIPEDDYQGMIDTVDARGNVGPNDAVVLDINWILMGPQADIVKENMGLERLTFRDSVFLDLDSAGALDMGPNKNVRLGRIREALSQNDPTQSWNFKMLEGQGPVMLRITQQASKQEGDDTIYNRVSRVAPVAA